MAFVNKISTCLKSDLLQINDITDIFDAVDNPTGWEDASTLLAANVTAAKVVITKPDSTILEYNVLSEIDDPVVGTFALVEDILIDLDGFYKIEYVIEAGTTYTACVDKLFYPKVKCCLSKLLISLAKDIENKQKYEDILKTKSLEKAMIEAVNVNDKLSAIKILNELTKICNHNPCGCK
jgi:hypothetical protein